MSPERIIATPDDELREAIRPAGFFMQKCAYLKAVAEFFIAHEAEYLASTRRVAERHLHLDGELPYDELQKIFMDTLPPDVKLYGECHALILSLCKDSCRKAGCGEVCKGLV